MIPKEKKQILELDHYLNEFTAIKNQALSFTNELTEAQFFWKPKPDKWSVGECISHLNVTGSQLLPRLRKAIDAGHKKGIVATPPFRYGMISRWFIRANDATSRFKMKSPKIYRPVSNESLEKSTVVSEFAELQDAFRVLTTNANGLDLNRIKVASPVSSLLRISLGAWLAATIAHEKRHLAQARRVTVTAGFPASNTDDRN